VIHRTCGIFLTLATLTLSAPGCQIDSMMSGTTAVSNSQSVEGWLRWRGPMQNGTSFEVGLPDTVQRPGVFDVLRR